MCIEAHACIVYTCMCACMCILCVSVCVCVQVHMHICAHMCVSACMNVFVCRYMPLCVYVSLSLHSSWKHMHEMGRCALSINFSPSFPELDQLYLAVMKFICGKHAHHSPIFGLWSWFQSWPSAPLHSEMLPTNITVFLVKGPVRSVYSHLLSLSQNHFTAFSFQPS